MKIRFDVERKIYGKPEFVDVYFIIRIPHNHNIQKQNLIAYRNILLYTYTCMYTNEQHKYLHVH